MYSFIQPQVIARKCLLSGYHGLENMLLTQKTINFPIPFHRKRKRRGFNRKTNKKGVHACNPRNNNSPAIDETTQWLRDVVMRRTGFSGIITIAMARRPNS